MHFSLKQRRNNCKFLVRISKGVLTIKVLHDVGTLFQNFSHFPNINCCIFTRATKKDFSQKMFQLVPSIKFILSTTACNPLFLARLVIPVLSLLSNILSSWGVHCSLPKEGSNTFRTETTSASKQKCGTKPNSETKIHKIQLLP